MEDGKGYGNSDGCTARQRHWQLKGGRQLRLENGNYKIETGTWENGNWKMENSKWKTERVMEAATAAQPIRDTAYETAIGDMKRMNSPVPKFHCLLSIFEFLFSSFYFPFSIFDFLVSIFHFPVSFLP